MQKELKKEWSAESVESRKLYLLNNELLKYKSKLYRESTRKFTLKNARVALRFLSTGAFSRIVKKICGVKDAYDMASYTLNPYNQIPSGKVVVYTCIWGGYDEIIEPVFINPNVDYIIFTDRDIDPCSAWKKINIPDNSILKGMTPIEINRYIKILPHKFFKEYDYSIYVDGNIKIVTDVMPLINDIGDCYIGIHNYPTNCIYKMKDAIIAGKKASAYNVKQQIAKYEKEGYPKGYGAFECNVIIRKHNTPDCIDLMCKWWDEFTNTTSKRDQLSFMYVLWKSGLKASDVYSLGIDVRQNPRFQVLKHK
jgi:hypothetical protein